EAAPSPLGRDMLVVMRIACVIPLLLVVGCGASSVTPPPKNVQASNTIVGGRVSGTAAELRLKGENAILAQKWQDAVDAYEALLAGDPGSNDDPQVIYSLAVAYEGIGQKEKARTRYREV